MDITLILAGKATLEDMVVLKRLGYEFEINNGNITEVLKSGE